MDGTAQGPIPYPHCRSLFLRASKGFLQHPLHQCGRPEQPLRAKHTLQIWVHGPGFRDWPSVDNVIETGSEPLPAKFQWNDVAEDSSIFQNLNS